MEFNNGMTRNENHSFDVLKSKIDDPLVLPSYTEMSKAINSLTNNYGVFNSKVDEDKWFKFLKNKENPIYEIWTKEYIAQFSNYLFEQTKSLGGTKESPTIVLEVGAGNGRLSYFLKSCLQSFKRDNLIIRTTNFHGGNFEIESKYEGVEYLSQEEALKKYNPEIVLCSWMPYGQDWSEDFRNTKSVKEYILIGPEGPCGTEETWEDFNNGFEKKEIKSLSELQISRLDILQGVKKISMQDFISKTYSYKRLP